MDKYTALKFSAHNVAKLYALIMPFIYLAKCLAFLYQPLP
jgi:hypothetical protein